MSSGKGGGGTSSTSSSTTTTQTVNEDNRVVGESASATLGNDAGLIINNEFSDNAAKQFGELITLAKSAGQAVVYNSELAIQSSQKALEIASLSSDKALKLVTETLSKNSLQQVTSGDKALTAVTTALERDKQGDKTIYTDLFPIIAVVAVVAVVIFFFSKK